MATKSQMHRKAYQKSLWKRIRKGNEQAIEYAKRIIVGDWAYKKSTGHERAADDSVIKSIIGAWLVRNQSSKNHNMPSCNFIFLESATRSFFREERMGQLIGENCGFSPIRPLQSNEEPFDLREWNRIIANLDERAEYVISNVEYGIDAIFILLQQVINVEVYGVEVYGNVPRATLKKVSEIIFAGHTETDTYEIKRIIKSGLAPKLFMPASLFPQKYVRELYKAHTCKGFSLLCRWKPVIHEELLKIRSIGELINYYDNLLHQASSEEPTGKKDILETLNFSIKIIRGEKEKAASCILELI